MHLDFEPSKVHLNLDLSCDKVFEENLSTNHVNENCLENALKLGFNE